MEYLKPCLGMKQEEWIRNLAWITSLRLQLPLLELVCAGDVQGGRQPYISFDNILMCSTLMFMKI